MSGQFHTLAALGQYSLDRRLAESQSQSGCCGEQKNLLVLQGIEPNLWVVQPEKLGFDSDQGLQIDSKVKLYDFML
jgi:hypothetical protein